MRRGNGASSGHGEIFFTQLVKVGTFPLNLEYIKAIRHVVGDRMEPTGMAETLRGGVEMKFYTIKLPKFLGGFVKTLLNAFNKN